MNTLSLTLLLLLGAAYLDSDITAVKAAQRVTQDTTSAKTWRQRAEVAEMRAEAAAREARMQKALAERAVEEKVMLKKKLEECEAKNKN